MPINLLRHRIYYTKISRNLAKSYLKKSMGGLHLLTGLFMCRDDDTEYRDVLEVQIEAQFTSPTDGF
jgi:hypothetical protein